MGVGPIVIAGGTGLLGTALGEALRHDGHSVVVLTRHPKRDHDVRWAPGETDTSWTSVLDGADAVINLAGASIAGGRWTTARKAAILDSRTQATGALARAITAARQPPRVFISSSAVGFYGTRGDEPLTEASPSGSDFLGQVGQLWEAAARGASKHSRLVLLRSGVVLARDGGALPQLALPFKLFAGGPAGTGRQFISWIHIHDWVEMVKWALAEQTIAGPLNVTSPNPVTNEEFARTIGRVLNRPPWLKAPAFALRLALGEMADALVLGGQRVLPEVARQRGFVFRYPALESALREIYR
jgi:uncharacterized protein (TIGR01777 family)